MTPLEYKRKKQLELAANLLRDSQLSISEIADKCGFYDLAYFGKVFKSYMKMSPKKYRR